jgi:pimeloyl-ACP methyl ester carboxylesterase
MPYLDLDGLRTHYQQTGSGPDVVLIHAFTSNLAIWMLTGIVETLSADYRVTSYDFRGHGMTAAPANGYTSELLATDFQRLHTELALEPAFIVGHSYGGVVGMHAARRYPDIVRGVILSDSYFPGLCDLEPDMGQAGPWRDLRENFSQIDVDLGETVDFSKLFRVVADLDQNSMAILTEKLGPAGMRWLSQMGQLAKTTAGDEMWEVAGLTADEISRIEQPVVALYDEFSPFKATCDFLKQNLANCVTDVVPGAKHLAPVQNSAEFVRLVQHNLRRLCDS